MPNPAQSSSQTLGTYEETAELRAALRRLSHATEMVALEHELTPRRYELLLFIQAANDRGEPPTVTTLCEPLQTTQASVTQLLETAVGGGLVMRTPSPTDRRSHRLQLSERGAQQLSKVFTALGPERERLAEALHGLL